MLERIRLAFAPTQPLGGRARLVLFCMVFALVMSTSVTIVFPVQNEEYRADFILGMVGAAALFAYLLQMVASAVQWVLDAYDEPGRNYFYRFTILFLLVAGIVVFAFIFRHETSGPHVGYEGCWYMHHDRWTGSVSIKQAQCPKEARPRYR